MSGDWTVIYETTSTARRRNSAILHYERDVAILFTSEGKRLLDWLNAYDWREGLAINNCVLSHAPKKTVEIIYDKTVVVVLARERMFAIARHLAQRE